MRRTLVLGALWLVLSGGSVKATSTVEELCDATLGPANVSAFFNHCGCTAQPTCGECESRATSIVAEAALSCYNGCEYCDPTETTCGTFTIWYNRYEIDSIVGSFLFVTDLVTRYRYEWTYTRGRTGTVTYEEYQDTPITDRICVVFIDGQACSSCEIRQCLSDDSLNPRVDCTNLEAGATAGGNETICNDDRLAGGYVPLDDSALNGILAPLAIPFYKCREGTSVLASAATPGFVRNFNDTMDNATPGPSELDTATGNAPNEPSSVSGNTSNVDGSSLDGPNSNSTNERSSTSLHFIPFWTFCISVAFLWEQIRN